MSELMEITRISRTTSAAVLAAAGLIVAGCSSPSGGAEPVPTSEAPKPSGLKSFDGCTVLNPGELQAHRLPPKGEPVDQGIGQPGCEFENDELTLGLFKAEGSDRAYWEERRDNFDVFVPNQVGAHQGIRTVAAGAKGQGVCTQYVEAGGGSVISMITYDSDQMAGKDPCAKAMEFAELIEPRLPG